MPAVHCREDIHPYADPVDDVPTPALYYRNAGKRKENLVYEEQQPVVKDSEKKLKCKYFVP